MPAHGIVVAGGGVAGLASALTLGRAGHPVTVLERDPLPVAPDVEAAFEASRPGAPQVHQTHGFLARVVVELRDHLPDVLDALLASGCTTMPMTADLGEPRPGDEDLAVLIVRRTTFEWVLRQAVLAEPAVEVRPGVGVRGLSARRATATGPVTVDGVELDDGSVVPADLVVAATGRRGDLPGWLRPHGIELPETVHESGLMYLTRWYRLPGDELDLDPKLGGDLGFVKYLGVPGDGGTLSITLAVRTDDRELRRALSADAGFEQACRLLPGPHQFFEQGPLTPIGGVRPMGGLINRIRRFLGADGAPLVRGVHAVGDAHTCTNPLYGRGCALAVVQAVRLALACTEHPRDADERARAYEASCEHEVEPWFDVSVQMDRMGADPAAAALGGGGEQGKAVAAVFAAAASDPVLGRGLVRFFNLLATPADLMADHEFLTRAMEVMADPDRHPLQRPDGPSRRELLEALAAADLAGDDDAVPQEVA